MQMTPSAGAPPREMIAGGMVKGAMMAAHIEWAVQNRPADQVERFWAAIPEELLLPLRGLILSISWYPFSHLMAVDRAIVSVYGGGDRRVLREPGALSARQGLTGVYKIYRKDSIHPFLEGAARLHSKFQDFGEARHVRLAPTAAQMLHSKYTSYSPMFCESAVGYYREALKMHGAGTVAVEESSCQCRGQESCTFDMRWS